MRNINDIINDIKAFSTSILRATQLFKTIFANLLNNETNTDQLTTLQTIKQHLVSAIESVDKLIGQHTAYIIVLNVFGVKQFVECNSKEAAIELADSFHGDDGKAFIFTNDLTVGGREESVGGTLVCESAEQVVIKATEFYNQ